MRTLIFRTVAPYLASLMILFSIFVLLRGHNEPGGGFIGGLIAASAFAIYGIACGVSPVRRALHFHPMAAGMLSIFFKVPFMTGLWLYIPLFGDSIAVSTVMLFDIGVYFVVVGSITSIALALEERPNS